MHGYKGWPDSDRRQTQDPDTVLAMAGLKAGMTVVDIGCGQGYFSLPAAKLVGEAGRVYGIDIDKDAIHLLDHTAVDRGIFNVRTFIGQAEQVVVCNACADVVFFGICLHDFEDPEKVLQNARRMLRPGARLVDLDWKKEPMEGGPPLEKRFSEEKASKLIRDAGFEIESVRDIGGRYYMILAKAP